VSYHERINSATGWLELGLPCETLYELRSLPLSLQLRPEALHLRLRAEMGVQRWNHAADTARLLCLKVPESPEFFLQAAFCLHETGDTVAARDWLLRGPKELMSNPIFHYNLACYLAVLGELRRARSHLRRAFLLDGSLREAARKDADLAVLRKRD
jgi:Flp pilus assembly protein TadD